MKNIIKLIVFTTSCFSLNSFAAAPRTVIAGDLKNVKTLKIEEKQLLEKIKNANNSSEAAKLEKELRSIRDQMPAAMNREVKLLRAQVAADAKENRELKQKNAAAAKHRANAAPRNAPSNQAAIRASASYELNKKFYTLAQQAALKESEQCQTLFNENCESSTFYRKLAFYAGTNCGHPEPHLVSIVCNMSDDPACAGRTKINGQKVIFINVNEKYWHKQLLGARIFMLHHEMQHLVLQHYKETNVHHQDEEREADKYGAYATKCQHCCREAVKWFLRLNEEKGRKDNPKNAEDRVYVKLKDLEAMDMVTIKNMIKGATKASKDACESSHPVPLERALRVFRYSNEPSIHGKTCKYHLEQIGNASFESSIAVLKKEEARLIAFQNEKGIKFFNKAPLKKVQAQIKKYKQDQERAQKLTRDAQAAEQASDRVLRNRFKLD